MKFNLKGDPVYTEIPSNKGLGLGVTKGDPMRQKVMTMAASHGPKGSGGGKSGAGPTGGGNDPAGSHLTGFHGKPPSVSANNAKKSPRDMSNGYKVSSSEFSPGRSKTSYRK